MLDYFDRSPLLGRERDRWNNQDFTRFGGMDWRSPTASPGNVSSATLENLPGLPSSFAAIPAASPGAAADAGGLPVDRRATESRKSLAIPVGQLRRHAQGLQLRKVNTGSRRSSRAYGELLYVDRRDRRRSLSHPRSACARSAATNPYNPFGTDVLVDVLLTDFGPANLHASHGDGSVGRRAARPDTRMGLGGVACRRARTTQLRCAPESWIQCALSAALTRVRSSRCVEPVRGQRRQQSGAARVPAGAAGAKSLSHGGDSIGRVRSRPIGCVAGGRS